MILQSQVHFQGERCVTNPILLPNNQARSTVQLWTNCGGQCTHCLLCRTFASVRTVPSVRGFETYENIYNLYTVSQFGGFPPSALPERETLGEHGEKYTLKM